MSRFLLAGLLTILGLLGPFSLGVQAQTTTTYAALDYEDYQKSPMANPQWDPFVQEGFQAFDRQDMQTTIEFLRKALSLGCTSPLAYFKLVLGFEAQASYYSAIQYYELAGKAFKKANESHRYAREFHANYGRALYMMGRTDRAYKVLEQAADTTKEFWILKLLGQMAMAKGDLIKATAYYEQALQNPDASTTMADGLAIYLELANAYFAKEDKVTGEIYYKKILQIDPNNKEAADYFKAIERAKNQEKVFEILGNH